MDNYNGINVNITLKTDVLDFLLIYFLSGIRQLLFFFNNNFIKFCKYTGTV